MSASRLAFVGMSASRFAFVGEFNRGTNADLVAVRLVGVSNTTPARSTTVAAPRVTI